MRKNNIKLTIMKRTGILLIVLLAIVTGISEVNFAVAENIQQNSVIKVLTTPDLYTLAEKWSKEFSTLNPNKSVEIIEINEDDIPDILFANNNITFISEKYAELLNKESIWRIVIGRSVVVPVVNAKNPYIDQLKICGVDQLTLSKAIKNPDECNWGRILKDGNSIPIHIYIPENEMIKTSLNGFLGLDDFNANILKNESEIISAVQNDPYAIGFCNIKEIIKSDELAIVDNIAILPIDKNGNGTIDYFEDIYKDLSSFTRGVWIGKYPKALSSDIYTVCSAQPNNEIGIDFLKYVLSDGQQFLKESGYSELVFGERQMKLDKLRFEEATLEATSDQYASYKILLLVIAGLIAVGIIIGVFVRFYRNNKSLGEDDLVSDSKSMNENSFKTPNGLYFDKTHTWTFMEENGMVKMGVDDFLQHITGPLSKIVMRNPGEKIKKGDSILTLIQDGKQLMVKAPVSGVIAEINEDLNINSEYINKSPYNQGWIYKIEPSNWLREIQFMSMAQNYRNWLKDEFVRLKDFIAGSVNVSSLRYESVVLQDGGEITDNVLSKMGPEVWEDFQTKFMDANK
jgi:glycine cleavage system H lipoate-binding protein/ABC-type phosphate transport system substrate-binding protein